jgi:hypothetical protein
MYALGKNPPAALVKYLDDPLIKSIRLEKQGKFSKYYYIDPETGHMRSCGGIHNYLKDLFYPNYVRKRKNYRTKRVKVHDRKASSKEEGKRMDKAIFDYVKTGKKPKMEMAKALIAYLEEKLGHAICGAQIPVYLGCLGGRVTQADVVTVDKEGRLYHAEIKCGHNASQKQGDLRGVPGAPNKDHSHWSLQSWYTTRGMREHGLPVHGFFVINVYKEGDAITVRKRANPEWLNRLPI